MCLLNCITSDPSSCQCVDRKLVQRMDHAFIIAEHIHGERPTDDIMRPGLMWRLSRPATGDQHAATGAGYHVPFGRSKRQVKACASRQLRIGVLRHVGNCLLRDPNACPGTAVLVVNCDQRHAGSSAASVNALDRTFCRSNR
jgi:hypothetical protein